MQLLCLQLLIILQLLQQPQGARGFSVTVPSRRPPVGPAHRKATRVRGGCPPCAAMASQGRGIGGPEVDIVALLGCCVCACERAAKVIRAVEAKRSAEGVIQGAVLKDSTDDRSYLTEADTAAQRVIMRTLRHSFPEVTIIGEEEEEEEERGKEIEGGSEDDLVVVLSRVGSQFEHAPAALRSVSVADVCVFVDPVDGTKEFVEGRLEAVQTLIGVSIQGRSVAGAVGIPFMPPWKGDGAPVHVMYGVADVGAKNIPEPSGRRPAVAQGAGAVLVASPSGKEQAIQVAKQGLQPAAVITPGGVGNKILSVLRGDADCALMHLSTSLWDTYVARALLVRCCGFLMCC